MSAPRWSVEEQTPRGYKYSLAVKLLDDVVPSILSVNNPLTRRVAQAFSWYVFLNEAAPTVCATLCGQEFNGDHREWGEGELEKIARALSKYAAMLLNEALQGADRGVLKPPKPPV